MDVISVDIYGPAAGGLAVLDISKFFMEAHGDWCIISHRRNFQLLAVIQDSFDWADHACCAGSEQLMKSVFVESPHDVAHENLPLYDVEFSPLSGQF